MKRNLLTLMGLACLLLLSIHAPSTETANAAAIIEDLWFTANDFPTGTQTGVAVRPDGLALTATAFSGAYTSPVIEAPVPFNAVAPQWIADIPESTSMNILLRTATAGGQWSPWYAVHASDDWTLPDDPDVVGEMVFVPAADGTHEYVQFSIGFSREVSLAEPVLQELRLTFIDSTAGPTAEELITRQAALNATKGVETSTTDYPKPFVISRDVWCTHPDCNYTAGLEYQPVTHLIIHHTVSNNSTTDWAANVRAIWNFHTYSRGWGDIGYNYLVDMNGVIYEGHNGGDDVVGTHAGGANAGSMGMALLGTFSSFTPPTPMLDSAVELLSWKADQKEIDVWDASDALPGIAWGLPTLMGHRDVYGGTNTACPGDRAHELLPWVRNQVASRIGLTSPYLYIDELSEALTLSNSNWYEGPGGCGNNGHSYYTWSTTNPAESANWGEWRPEIPASGRYEIQVYAPYCKTDRAETDGATYTIHHTHGENTVVISHDDNVGLWMSLGQFDLLEGEHTLIRLTDLTTTDSGLGVWFDGLRLRPIDTPVAPPTVSPETPAAGTWTNQRAVNFTWNVANAATVLGTTLEVATDPEFSNVIVHQNWSSAVTQYTHAFTQDYSDLYWRVIVNHTLGSPVISTPSHFGLDATPPTSTATKIFRTISGDFVVTWQGEDDGSGIVAYHVDYRGGNDSQWSRWLTETPATTATYVWPDSEIVYRFRTQAIDKAGNVETAHATADISSDQAISLSHAIMLPAITR